MIKFVNPDMASFESIEKDLRIAFDTKWLTNGPYVKKLEEKFGQMFNVNPECVVGVNSATTGNMLAIRTMCDKNITVNPLVGLPALSFMTNVSSILWNNGHPVFIDIDEFCWDIDKISLKNSHFDFLLMTHIFGLPCDVKALEEYGVIYDCAHALGTCFRNKSLLKYGDFNVFSFGMQKQMACGEGGVVVCKEKQDADVIRQMRYYGNDGKWDSRFLGLNGKMQEFNAIVALKQLEHLPEQLQAREQVEKEYDLQLLDVVGIYGPTFEDKGDFLRNYYAVRVIETEFGIDADNLSAKLLESGIETRRMYPIPACSLSIAGLKKDEEFRFINAKILSKELLALPLNVTLDQVREVCNAIRKVGGKI